MFRAECVEPVTFSVPVNRYMLSEVCVTNIVRGLVQSIARKLMSF